MEAANNEKKWFIYVTDHHEGPLTVEEIGEGVKSGKFSRFSFVWCQGMTDWLPMGEVEEFQIYTLRSTDAATAPAQSAPMEMVLEEPSLVLTQPEVPQMGSASSERTITTIIERETLSGKFPNIQREKTRTALKPIVVAERTGSIAAETDAPVATSKPAQTEPPAPLLSTSKAEIEDEGGSWFMRLGLIILLAASGMVLYKIGLLKRPIENIQHLLGGLPALPDVDPEDYMHLKIVAKSPLSMGPQIGLAISKADPISPQFYVVTNLPSGAMFEVHWSGIQHTLLTKDRVHIHLEVFTERGLGKTSPIRLPSQAPLPRGEYTVTVVEKLDSQPDAVMEQLAKLSTIDRNVPEGVPSKRKVIFSKKFFIGLKDQSYLDRLAEQHDRLKAQSAAEILGIRQLLTMLDNQFKSTNSNFDRLKVQNLGPRQLKAWRDFQSLFHRLQAQMDSEGQSSGVELQTDLNVVVQDLSSALLKFHEIQDEFFTKKIPLEMLKLREEAFRKKWMERWRMVQDTAEALDKHPLDENGLPNIVQLPAMRWDENL